MLSVLAAVLPIFALILAGWGARRTGALGPHATGELNRFVVWLALPALLFDIVAHARWSAIWQPGFLAAFAGGMAAVFAITLALRLRAPRHLADAAIDGLNAAYANTGFIGFPLLLAVLGPDSLAPTLIATILTVCVIFATALVIIEIGLQTERHPRRMALSVAGRLARNPLLVSPLAGAVFMGLGLPVPMESFFKLLGGAASPCALVALGLFIAEKREGEGEGEGEGAGAGAVALLVGLKLLVQPALTWLLATQLLHLAAPLTRMAVLLAALPTGTGPFMVAEFYRREARLTARAVLVSTVLSLLTITAYLAW